jgi:hypothetical protein
MNKFLLPILISTVLISGCKNPFEAKDKGIDQLNNIEQRWIDTSTLISSTSRIALAPQVANLQEMKRDLNVIEVSECLTPAKNELNEYMEMEIDIYLKFMADELSDSYAASQKKKMLEKVTNYRTLKSKCTGE